eukprot:scaffold1798_cov118-Isochrysis_galbana.AAC.2
MALWPPLRLLSCPAPLYTVEEKTSLSDGAFLAFGGLALAIEAVGDLCGRGAAQAARREG